MIENGQGESQAEVRLHRGMRNRDPLSMVVKNLRMWEEGCGMTVDPEPQKHEIKAGPGEGK